MDRGAWSTTDHGVTKSQTQLLVHTQMHTHRRTKTEDVEHILMCLLAICVYFLVLWCSICKIFCPFLCDCLSVADLYSSLCIHDISPL